ncbi:MAG: Crp/Fnr family transcriptional regulator [Bacteroidales bacterium]
MEEPKHINCRECDRASECFQHLYPEELVFINSRKIQLTYRKGENLFKQGAFSPNIMYMAEGLARVFLQTGRNSQVNIRLAGTGEFLALHSLFGQHVYNCSAVALKESTVCMIEKKGLMHLLERNSDFGVRMISKNCRNESHLLHIIENITSRHMRGKLASALLYLASYDQDKQPVFPWLSRKDIAGFAGISHESTIRYLKEFEKDGLIRVQGRDIQITDRDRLELIGEKG